MVEIADIQERSGLEEWLNELPEEYRIDYSIQIASRAALRILPITWGVFLKHRDAQSTTKTISALRGLLIAFVSSRRRNERLADAAEQAASTLSQFVPGDMHIRNVAEAASTACGEVNVVHSAASTVASTLSAYQYGGFFLTADAEQSAADSRKVWEATRIDCAALANGQDLTSAPIWMSVENLLKDRWSHVMTSVMTTEWTFWIDWYEDVLAGNPMNWEMLEQIALIPDEVWDGGPGAVAKEIEKRCNNSRTDPANLEPKLRTVPKAKPQVIPKIRDAMQRNARELPPTFDAIESLIALEIERLQTKNYESDADREECRRQIGIYLTLHAAIVELRARVSQTGSVTFEQAEESERLLSLFFRELGSLPREKVGEVKEGIWETSKGLCQFGLISGSGYLATLYGIHPTTAVSVAALCFAPKKAGDILKAAKEIWVKPPG